MNYQEGYKFHPQGAGQPPIPEPRRRSKLASFVRGIVIVAIVLFLVGSCTAVVFGSLTQEIANEAIVDPTADEGPSFTVDVFTASQQQAIESAQQYVDFSGFSKYGLMQQLTSDAGSGFTQSDAAFALKHITVDYNAEAVEAAQSYLDLTSFSRKGLINQLSSKAGSGFTLKQATYAADKVGL